MAVHVFGDRIGPFYACYADQLSVPAADVRLASVVIDGRTCTKHRYAVRGGYWLVLPPQLVQLPGFRSDHPAWIDLVWSAGEARLCTRLATAGLAVPVRAHHLSRLAGKCRDQAHDELQALLWTETAACLA